MVDFERFTHEVRLVLVVAKEQALSLNHNYIGTEHLLLGLIHEGQGVAAAALDSVGVSIDLVNAKIEEFVGRGDKWPPSGFIGFTNRARKVLELSGREALQLDHDYIDAGHLLLGLIDEGEGVATQILISLGVDLDATFRKRVHPAAVPLNVVWRLADDWEDWD